MIKRSQESIRRYQKRSSSNKTKKWKSIQKAEDTSSLSRVGFTVKLLTGLMEDLPTIILIFYSSIIPICGISQIPERYSPTTIATVVSSVLNSMWSMFILYWDLFGCNKKMSEAQCCCTVIRSIYKPSTVLSICYCGCCGCATTSGYDCLCLCHVERRPDQLSEAKVQSRYQQISIWGRKALLLSTIFSLYLLIIVLGSFTLRIVLDAPPLDSLEMRDGEYTRSIRADIIGPGLDSRTDASMFVTMVYELPNWYHVGLYDNRDVNIANSASVYQMQNRLYIGQFNELEHLKDGTLAKAIPCSRVFPFLEQIDESIFQWNNSQKIYMTDFNNCKLIFQLRYHPTNNNWNIFINIEHLWKYITVEWGIYIKDRETCPTGFQPLPISSLLTESVKWDIVNYTCSPTCINYTDICRNATYGQFEEGDSVIPSIPITEEPKMYLTINNQQTADICQFRTFFEFSTKFCDRIWAEFPPVKVPEFVKQTYPQFITIPVTYKNKDNTLYPSLDSKCSKLWAEGEKIAFSFSISKILSRQFFSIQTKESRPYISLLHFACVLKRKWMVVV